MELTVRMTVCSLQVATALMLMICGDVTATPSSPRNQVCSREGRQADPNDCGGYYNCIKNKNGVIEPIQKYCPKGGFNANTASCDVTMRGCSSRQARMQSRVPELDYKCAEITADFVCLDCQTMITCVGGNAYEEPCGVNAFCSSSKNNFMGAVCTNDEPSECKCKGSNDYEQDVYNDAKFRECPSEINRLTGLKLFECPEGMVFSNDKQECTYKDGSPRCERMGVLPIYDDCNVYYKCISHKTGFVRERKTCPDGLMLNENKKLCQDPCLWADKTFSCSAEGRFANVTDCSQFFICSKSDQGFDQLPNKCPGDSEWLQNEDGIDGKCLPKKLSTCQPKEFTKCKIPTDTCAVNQAMTSDSDSNDVTSSPPQETTPPLLDYYDYVNQLQ